MRGVAGRPWPARGAADPWADVTWVVPFTCANRRLLGIVVAVGVATAACSNGDTAPTAGPTAGAGQDADPSGAAQLAPAAFADAVADGPTFVLNVHVPDEGSIAGTDAAIPFDQVEAQAAELPQDRSTRLAVYCRSGRMSAEAVVTLRELGYSNVVELEGGMNAWVDDGRELLPPAG